MAQGPARFAYHRSLAPMMWVLFGLAVIEAAVMHLLVALWNPLVALVLSVLSLAMVVWLVLLIRSFRTYPVLIGEGALVWRCGTLRSVTVPLESIGASGPRGTMRSSRIAPRSIWR